MELLMVTSCWPHTGVVEFLDDEIRHLTSVFGRVTVAPLRPKGQLADALPPGVIVDHSLADRLERTALLGRRRSRLVTAAARALRPNPAGFGASRAEFRRDGRNPSWLRTSLLVRADSTSVADWARSRPRPTIAYTFWLGAATLGLRSAWPELPLVSRVHGGDLFSEAQGWASIPFQADEVRAASLLASVSERGRNYLSHKFPESESKMVVRRLGISDIGRRVRRADDGRVRMLSASSIDSNKRVVMIGQVAQILAREREVEWTHLGDGESRGALEASLASKPASLQVRIRGQVSLPEVHRELRSGGHDVFVNLSLSEGAPVSLMEAQCAGLPVVATAVGGTPEVVPARWNELVSDTSSASEVSQAVIRACTRPPEETDMRRNYWATHYSARTNYSQWAAELAHLASEARSSG